MTTDERFERLERLTAGLAEELAEANRAIARLTAESRAEAERTEAAAEAFLAAIKPLRA